MAEWYFRPKGPGEDNREGTEGEFFAADAISEPGMALVREAIQNSLDARLPDGSAALVRIRLSGQDGAVSAGAVAPYFDGLRDHLAADDNGLRQQDFPERDEPCSYVVIEDMYTRGLEGDPTESYRPRDGHENHFYHFFRAYGQSDKDTSQRGSWGVGKCVFPRSSRINCMFGMSIRASDGARLLMGKTTLKSHWLDDGQHYQDGFYGVRDGSSHLVLPVEDPATIDHFMECFGLQRRDESGLSVVVPWPYDDITSEQIVCAVLRGYFWPILTGQLEVMVEVPSMPEVWLDAANIISTTGEIGGELARDLLPMLKLADWARALPEDGRTLIAGPEVTRRWQWSRDLVPEETAKALQEALEGYRRIAVRVPVTIRPKEGHEQRSHFDVYAVRDADLDRARPTFIREGIIVSRVKAPWARGLCGLVVAEDGPIAAFLRDAENPSHTEWQHQGSKFRGMYVSGRTDLEFVTRSVHEIIRILSESEQEEDRTLLVDVFSLPTEQDGVQSGDVIDEDEDGGVSPEDTPPPPPAKPRAFRMDKVTGGFVVMASGVDDAPVPEALEVNVAYDTRRGNPLKRYNVADFELGEAPVEIALSGLRLDECSGNRMVVALTDTDFRVEVTGFDPNRDLYLRVTPREASHADQTA